MSNPKRRYLTEVEIEEKVLTFLKTNADRKFSRDEILKGIRLDVQTRIEERTISISQYFGRLKKVLRKLEKYGRIERIINDSEEYYKYKG